MPAFDPGLVHTPVTPFRREGAVDFDRYGTLLEFHIGHGADALALPMHAGESVSLPDGERRALLEFAIARVNGRRPVIAHVSETGTAIAAALARHAEAVGAAAVVATTPYYWTPPPAMLLEHFALIGGAVKIPLFVHNAPDDMAGARVTAELMVKLIGRLETFAGLIDTSLDWQFMIELMTLAKKVRPEFQLLAGNELMVSAAAIGATGMVSSLAAVAPGLVRALYESCRDGKLFEARAAQERMASLRHAMKPGGAPQLKAALRALGRDCGDPRPPLMPVDAADAKALSLALDTLLADEPRGW